MDAQFVDVVGLGCMAGLLIALGGGLVIALRALAFAREVVSAELARRPQPIGAVKVSEAWQEEV